MQSFVQQAESVLPGLLGSEVFRQKMSEVSRSSTAKFLALADLALEVARGRVVAPPRIFALPTPAPLATLPVAAAPTPPTISDHALLALGKKVFGNGAFREGASRADIEAKFRMEQIRLPGASEPTRELFGVERMVRASRQEIVDRFVKAGKL